MASAVRLAHAYQRPSASHEARHNSRQKTAGREVERERNQDFDAYRDEKRAVGNSPAASE